MKRVLDLFTMGADRPINRLLTYYLVLGLIAWPLIYFFPVVDRALGGAILDATESGSMVLEDGGDLILLAACPEGLGRPDFLDWFVPGGADATARMLIHSYKLNGQTAWGIRWKSERYRVRLVSDLPPDAVKRMGMIGHASLDEAIASSDRGPGWILPQALGTLPVLREGKAA